MTPATLVIVGRALFAVVAGSVCVVVALITSSVWIVVTTPSVIVTSSVWIVVRATFVVVVNSSVCVVERMLVAVLVMVVGTCSTMTSMIYM